MKKVFKYLLITPLVILSAILIFLLVVWFFLFRGEPKITVDYTEEYYRITKPDGFDPNDNANEFYRKADEVYYPPSELVKMVRNKEIQDMNEADESALREWVEKNAQCIKYIEEGNKKRFFWAEKDTNESGWGISKNFGSSYDYDLIILLKQKAKNAAMNGNYEEALAALMDWWRFGQHYSNSRAFSPRRGMKTKGEAVEESFKILDYSKLDANALRLWQEKWQKEFNADYSIPCFERERLMLYDLIQKNFIYQPEGKGRLHLRSAIETGDSCCYSSFIQWFYSVLTCPDSNEVSCVVKSVCDYYQNVMDKTPWEMRDSATEFEDNLEKMKKKQPIFDFFIPNLKPTWLLYHRLKAQQNAIITAIAILRYKADHNSYPENLELLLKDKYIKKLPIDPFSGCPLGYLLFNDEFEIYSVGIDFIDDKGKGVWGHSLVFAPNDVGDEIFWPPLKRDLRNRKLYRFKSER